MYRCNFSYKLFLQFPGCGYGGVREKQNQVKYNKIRAKAKKYFQYDEMRIKW